MSGLLDHLLKAVHSRATSGLDYVELRADDVLQTSIELRESAIESITRKFERGHSARVLVSGRWGFATSDGMRDPKATIVEASKAAKALSGGIDSDTGLCDVKPVRKDVRHKVRAPLDEIELEDKVSYLTSICQGVVKADPRMTTTKASYMDITGDRALVTSDGAAVRTAVSHGYLMTVSSGKAPGLPVSVRDEIGTVTSGWEYFTDKNPKELVVGRLVGKAKQQMAGVSCKRGTFPCVVSHLVETSVPRFQVLLCRGQHMNERAVPAAADDSAIAAVEHLFDDLVALFLGPACVEGDPGGSAPGGPEDASSYPVGVLVQNDREFLRPLPVHDRT